MKPKNLPFLLLFLFASIFVTAQIEIDCSNRIGIYTAPNASYGVNIKGDTRIRFPSGRSLIFQYDSSHGWDMSPDVANKGDFGYYSYFYTVGAKYMYADIGKIGNKTIHYYYYNMNGINTDKFHNIINAVK